MSAQAPRSRKLSFNPLRPRENKLGNLRDAVPIRGSRVEPNELRSSIRLELKDNVSRPHTSTGYSDSFFITLPTVQRIIDLGKLEILLRPLSWYHEDLLEYIWKHCLLVIATLIHIEWSAWGDFKTLFLDKKDQSKRPKHGDHYLPFDYDDLAFLKSERTQRLFDESQYIFCPFILKEDQDGTCKPRQRLPFIHLHETRAGGFGQVLKIEVERHQIEYKQGKEVFKNDKRTIMALKVIDDRESGAKGFADEVRVLNQFKRASLQSRGICMNFSTFVRGNTLNILSKWADFDLFDFLRGKYPNYVERARHFTLYALFEQTRSLAQALKFLHYDLDIDGPRSCAHLDLKPENILVEWEYDNDESNEHTSQKDMPVGRWKINDFGISSIRSIDNGQTEGDSPIAGDTGNSRLTPGDIHVMLRDRSSVPPPRGPGPFLPPEMKIVKSKAGGPVVPRVSRSSDMWSLGCIIAMVLAFALGGPEKASELYSRRVTGYADDFFWTCEEKPVVKEEVTNWFDEQSKLPEYTQIKPLILECQRLVFDLLKVNKDERPKAPEACERLLKIRKLTNNMVLPWSPKQPVFNSEEQQYPTSQPSQSRRRRSTLPAIPDLPASPTTIRRPSASCTTSTMELKVPRKTTRTTWSASGEIVVFVGQTEAYLYDLSQRSPLYTMWMPDNDRAKCIDNVEYSSSHQVLTCSSGREWTSAIASGTFLALISVTIKGTGADGRVELYDLQSFREIHLLVEKELPDDYIGLYLSSKGQLMVLHRCEVELLHRRSDSQISAGKRPINGDLLTAAFTTDGNYFCAWYKTPKPTSGNQEYGWAIWDTRTLKVQTSQKTRLPEPRQRAPSQSHLLVPFNEKPHFLAVDHYGKSWLIRKDGPDQPEEADAICEGVLAGAALPSDVVAILLRSSQVRSKPRVDVVKISPAYEVSVRKLIQLEHKYDSEESGIAILADGEDQCLLTSHSYGRLFRRVFVELSAEITSV